MGTLLFQRANSVRWLLLGTIALQTFSFGVETAAAVRAPWPNSNVDCKRNGQTCTANDFCCNANEHCIHVPDRGANADPICSSWRAPLCKVEGEQCVAHADCCGGLTCTNGRCTAPPAATSCTPTNNQPAQPQADPNRPLLQTNRNLRLIEPPDATNALDGTRWLAPQAGINMFFCYFNLTWPWILGIGAGIAVLQALAGGIQIMLSAGAEQKSAGESRLTWALVGLAVIGLAGFILRILNPIFYR